MTFNRVVCGKLSWFIQAGGSMPSLIMDIALSGERLQAIYGGRANRVLLRSRDGPRVNLPAHHLRPFIGHDGVHGTFRLDFSEDGRLLALQRLA